MAGGEYFADETAGHTDCRRAVAGVEGAGLAGHVDLGGAVAGGEYVGQEKETVCDNVTGPVDTRIGGGTPAGHVDEGQGAVHHDGVVEDRVLDKKSPGLIEPPDLTLTHSPRHFFAPKK